MTSLGYESRWEKLSDNETNSLCPFVSAAKAFNATLLRWIAPTLMH